MMSPMRRSTSPRAGAGVARQTSNPRRADSTALSTSAAPDSGKRPIDVRDVGRIRVLEILAADRRHPIAADEVLEGFHCSRMRAR